MLKARWPKTLDHYTSPAKQALIDWITARFGDPDAVTQVALDK
jgi:hypothetical protein